jgi:hypothetical protein
VGDALHRASSSSAVAYLLHQLIEDVERYEVAKQERQAGESPVHAPPQPAFAGLSMLQLNFLARDLLEEAVAQRVTPERLHFIMERIPDEIAREMKMSSLELMMAMGIGFEPNDALQRRLTHGDALTLLRCPLDTLLWLGRVDEKGPSRALCKAAPIIIGRARVGPSEVNSTRLCPFSRRGGIAMDFGEECADIQRCIDDSWSGGPECDEWSDLLRDHSSLRSHVMEDISSGWGRLVSLRVEEANMSEWLSMPPPVMWAAYLALPHVRDIREMRAELDKLRSALARDSRLPPQPAGSEAAEAAKQQRIAYEETSSKLAAAELQARLIPLVTRASAPLVVLCPSLLRALACTPHSYTPLALPEVPPTDSRDPERWTSLRQAGQELSDVVTGDATWKTSFPSAPGPLLAPADPPAQGSQGVFRLSAAAAARSVVGRLQKARQRLKVCLCTIDIYIYIHTYIHTYVHGDASTRYARSHSRV